MTDTDDEHNDVVVGNQDDTPWEEACREACLEPKQENKMEVGEDFHCLHALQSSRRRCASLQDFVSPL